MSKESDTKHVRNEIKLETLQCLKEERQISDGRYALKIAETIAFGLVGLICTAVVVALLSLILK